MRKKLAQRRNELIAEAAHQRIILRAMQNQSLMQWLGFASGGSSRLYPAWLSGIMDIFTQVRKSPRMLSIASVSWVIWKSWRQVGAPVFSLLSRLFRRKKA